ncbi:Hypothetical predicted protein [Pelobates cultripes]|uniref:Helix-turn-helix domain-containing protein n=1 Tax=Pelobates cultripes TaxID=61616 RepID=A0AAD1VTK6_PELCU|nr:Hypothetical predicted protein [Pelobates cultripes]
MVEELNKLPTPIRFTAQISSVKVQYLHVELSVGVNRLEYSLYTKTTDRNTLLHSLSAHPQTLIESLPKAQYHRVMRNNSNDLIKERQLSEMTEKFLQRGYKRSILDEALNEAREPRVSKEEMFKHEVTQKLVFPTTYHQSTKTISSGRIGESCLRTIRSSRSFLKNLLFASNGTRI